MNDGIDSFFILRLVKESTFYWQCLFLLSSIKLLALVAPWMVRAERFSYDIFWDSTLCLFKLLIIDIMIL
jgi:hypothetical protein